MGNTTKGPTSLKDPDGNPHWVNWSCNPHTEDEIRETVLHDYNTVCFSYVCRYSTMSEDFIKELIVLSTGIFSGGNSVYYTENNIKLVRKILFVEPTTARLEYQRNLKKRDIGKADPVFVEIVKQWKIPLRTKVDWWQIANYQPNLSEKFIQEFEDKFRENGVRSNVELDRALLF